jgi:predicted Ser/Thr protein kinase
MDFNLSEGQKKRLAALLEKATNLDQLGWIEKELAEGRLPPGVLDEESPEPMAE